jgi:hypothetical protein
MFTATKHNRTPIEQKHFERTNIFARFADRAAEARMKSQLLTFPFTY